VSLGRRERPNVPVIAITKPNLYKDSLALMRVTEQVLARRGVQRATLVMGTPANKEILAEARLLPALVAQSGPTDLIVVIDAESAAAADEALAEAERLLAASVGPGDLAGAPRTPAVRSLAMAAPRLPDAQLVQISVPGPYAGAEALKALKAGRHVFLFSDNVALSEELVIKQHARARNLLVMGPDCGTAILNGVPLGFANIVRRGPIGLVGASGTGLQEMTSQIHALGGGVSHAIGTGSRDVSAEVGAITLLQGLDLLAGDDATRVIAVVAKPPAPEVADKVLARLAAIAKPAVVLFIGSSVAATGTVHSAGTLYEAAAAAVRLAGGKAAALEDRPAARPPFVASQKYVRALYSGGTFCYEAQHIWRTLGLSCWSNAPIDKTRKLVDSRVSVEHTAVDLGEDEFTVGKPHPMIDPALRIERFRHEAHDRAVAVILLDIVLGYGAHADPAGALVPVIRDARLGVAREGRSLAVVAFVCGTEDDPQRRSVQEQKLRDAGALVFGGSTAAAYAAARLAGYAR